MSEQATQATEYPMTPQLGTFCWMEIASKNIETAVKFYSELLGWKFQQSKNTDFDYREFGTDENRPMGGAMQMGAEFGDTPSHWMGYIAVANVDESAEKVKELGGTICVPPTDIPNTGRFCVITDPTGAKVSLITLKSA